MSSGVSQQGAGPNDPTFRSYSAAQAAAYAKSRKGYSDTLYNYILNHHSLTGGQSDLLLDVGCGPGNATRDLALHFDHAVGCDPGQEMIAQAKTGSIKAKTGEDVVFEVCAAEDVDKINSIQPASVDLLICAMSAHWFQLERFYPAAAQVLKPGGTLAMWTCGSFFVHPDTPNAAAVQKHLDWLLGVALEPYTTHGNRLSYEVYDTLPLPWTLDPQVCGTEFKQEGLHRKVWNRDGKIAEGEAGGFVNGGNSNTLAESQIAVGTASMVTRWREANKEKVAKGEIRDCVEEAYDNIRIAMGVKKGEEDKTMVSNGMATGLIMLKRA